MESNQRTLLMGALRKLPIAVMIFRSVRGRDGAIVDFEWVYTNSAATRIVGRSDEELRGKHLLVEMPGNRESGLFDCYVRVVETDTPDSHEFQYAYDSLDIWFSSWSAKVQDGFVVTFSEVTEARSLRLKSAHQASILQGMYAQSPFAACVVDGQSSEYAFCNEAFEELVDKRGLVGTPLRQDYPASGAGADLLDILEHVRGTRRPYSVPEYQMSAGRGGTVRHYRIVAGPLDAENVSSDSIQLVAVDVTALVGSRLRAEELAWQLAEEEEQYRATFTFAPVGIAHIDLDGKLIDANDHLAEALGYEKSELLSFDFADLFPPDSEHPWTVVERLSFSGEPRKRADQPFLRKDGSLLSATLTVSLLRGRQGQPKHYLAIVEDVSDLVEAKQRLEESHRHKDQFLAVLGHELRNPLAVLRSASELLSHAEITDPIVATVRDKLERQSLQMKRLIDDLLDLGRISRGKIQLETEAIDLVDVIDECLKDLRGVDEEAPPIVCQSSLQQVVIRGDRVRLTQVFLNLLKNAIKYTPPEGEIVIKLQKEGDRALARVVDTGVGIEAEFLERLFQPFEQAPQDLARAQGGLGLGLALSAQVIKLHGGSIQAFSEGRGRGAEFLVSLPLCHEHLESAGTGRPHPGDPSSVSILLVEDNQDAAELLQMLLESKGHEVVHVATGAQALEYLDLSKTPLVMICDLGLPKMSGYELAERVRSRAEFASMYLIALSGYGRAEDKARARSCGFDAHLTKPADIDTLQVVLRRVSQKNAHD